MKITFTSLEVKEIILSAVVLSFAFAIAFLDGIGGMAAEFSKFPELAVFSFIAVGIGFLAHELIGHKIIAQRLGLHAEYKMWKFGLLIAFASSLAGFVFAAPGAVYVSPKVDLWGRAANVSKKRMGIVSISGPLVNLGIAIIFFALHAISPMQLFVYAIWINLWLAIFNMLPIPPLDGSKVLAWDKRIWAVLFAVLIGMFLAVQPLFAL